MSAHIQDMKRKKAQFEQTGEKVSDCDESSTLLSSVPKNIDTKILCNMLTRDTTDSLDIERCLE